MNKSTQTAARDGRAMSVSVMRPQMPRLWRKFRKSRRNYMAYLQQFGWAKGINDKKTLGINQCKQKLICSVGAVKPSGAPTINSADLTPAARRWSSILFAWMLEVATLATLKERERGRRAFILGNGPSILSHDLSRLKGELVIGMNASTMLEAEHGFRASYYVVSDMRFLVHPEKRKYATSELRSETMRVLRAELATVDDADLSRQSVYIRALGRDGFSWNLRRGFYFGCSTTMLAIQLAVYLGCSEIYLLGQDLRYAEDQPRFYHEDIPEPQDPFTSIQVWNIANAHRETERRGIRLRLCSEKSLLRPYIPFEEFEGLFAATDDDWPRSEAKNPTWDLRT